MYINYIFTARFYLILNISHLFQTSKLETDRILTKDAANFLLESMIPKMVSPPTSQMYKNLTFQVKPYSTLQYNAIQCNTMQYNAIQCNAMQCNAIQCNTMQYNTIQYNTNLYTGYPIRLKLVLMGPYLQIYNLKRKFGHSVTKSPTRYHSPTI